MYIAGAHKTMCLMCQFVRILSRRNSCHFFTIRRHFTECTWQKDEERDGEGGGGGEEKRLELETFDGIGTDKTVREETRNK